MGWHMTTLSPRRWCPSATARTRQDKGSVPPGSLPRQNLPQPPTPIQPGGCGPPPVGPSFPRPTSPMTGSSPGCHTRSFHQSSTMGATSTTLSASVACLDAPGSPSSTAPGLTSTTITGRTPAVSSSWTPRPGHVGPLPLAGPSVSPSLPSQLSATGLRGHSPARPLGPRHQVPGGIPCRQSRSTPALRSSSSTLRPPGQGVYADSSL